MDMKKNIRQIKKLKEVYDKTIVKMDNNNDIDRYIKEADKRWTMQKNTDNVRQFKSGAYRDGEKDKNDYEGFLSPLVIESFGNYMTKHRKQSNGEYRESDNWQLGIEQAVYMKSMWRHFLDVWKIHRGIKVNKDGHDWDLEEALNALVFNVMGMQHENLKNKIK